MGAGMLGGKLPKLLGFLSASALLLCAPMIAHGQSQSITPGQQIQGTDGSNVSAIPGTTADQLSPTNLGANVPRPDDSSIGQIESEPEPQPLDANSTFSFTLNGLNIAGLSVYDPEDFDDIVGDFLNTEVTLGSLREISNRIERRYRSDGFVATRVIIPPQAIRDGTPTLEVFEGKIIHYEINGEIGPVKKQMASLLDNLLTDEPARWTDLERYLLLARDLPGISLTGTLRSAGDSAPGGVILVVDAARKPIDGFVNLQNRNAEPTGTFTISGGAAANSNTEYAERIGGVALLALEVPEQVTGFASYEQSIGNDGMIVRFTGTHGFSEPKDALRDLELSTSTTILNVALEYPVVRSRDVSIWTRGGVEFSDQRTSASGQELFDDQVRLLFAGARGLFLPPLGGVSEFDFELRQGLSTWGAPKISAGRSRADATPDFTVVKGSISHTQPVPPFFEIFGSFEGQHSNKPLPTIEEMSLGELTVGRGYEPGSLTADTGFGVIGELRFFPPGVEAWWLDSFQVYGFLDYGRAYDIGNPTNNPAGFEELASGGFGIRFQVFETFFGDVYYAQPTTRGLSTSERQPEPTVKFTLTKFF
ncbi:MAG: POTRA domain-containing protein [Pseudomonadota bacterium]